MKRQSGIIMNIQNSSLRQSKKAEVQGVHPAEVNNGARSRNRKFKTRINSIGESFGNNQISKFNGGQKSPKTSPNGRVHLRYGFPRSIQPIYPQGSTTFNTVTLRPRSSGRSYWEPWSGTCVLPGGPHASCHQFARQFSSLLLPVIVILTVVSPLLD